MSRLQTFLFLTLLVLASACERRQPMPEVTASGTSGASGKRPTQEQMIALNKDIVTDEATDIRLLIQRYGWNMQKTESGLYYEITAPRQGNLLQKGDQVQLKYRITLLNGNTVYQSSEDGLMEVVVEKSDAPVGLHQLLRQMKRGEKAHAIIPAHLAYGQVGDGNKIPGFVSLVYYVEVME